MSIWNLWHGCHKISAGCKNCDVYRTDAKYEKDSSVVKKTGNFNLSLKRNRQGEYKLQPDEIVYTCFTSDFLLPDADEWRNDAWNIMRLRHALHDLLSSLYVVPVFSSRWIRFVAFLKFFFLDGVHFKKAKAVFNKEKLSDTEKRVMDLARQSMLSTAEIMKCVETSAYDLSGDEKIMEAIYDDDFTTSDNIGYYAQLFKQQRSVLLTVSNLYLRKLIIFERN